MSLLAHEHVKTINSPAISPKLTPLSVPVCTACLQLGEFVGRTGGHKKSDMPSTQVPVIPSRAAHKSVAGHASNGGTGGGWKGMEDSSSSDDDDVVRRRHLPRYCNFKSCVSMLWGCVGRRVIGSCRTQ